MATSASRDRFSFGENWTEFARLLDDERIDAAKASLTSMLHSDGLDGRSFLDIGCGSGLFSLAAVRLHAARVHSLDFDADSVACSLAVREAFYPTADNWHVERGDITDSEYCASLGSFDVVYAWGVLHHTGALWQALDNTCNLIAPGGSLFVSIYNDQGSRSRRWRKIKRLYNVVPRAFRVPYALTVSAPGEVSTAARRLVRGRLAEYLSSWREPGPRGMSRWHDLIDWVGGHPFEVATPDEVFRFCRDRGLSLTELTTVGGGSGCNEFVFHRASS
jgi:SAM-dependent methyltransferase